MIKRLRQCIARKLVKSTARNTLSLFHEARGLKSEARNAFERAETAKRCAESLEHAKDNGAANWAREIAAENSKISSKLNETARRLEDSTRTRRQRARKIARIIAGKRKRT